MKIYKFIKQELTSWKNFEIFWLITIFVTVIISAITLKDSPAAVFNAICGILYTVIAGKGKISCYFFGLAGSLCYIYLALQNGLWGNTLLYACYYIPMQITGIFQWKKHLKKYSNDIVKTSLKPKSLFYLIVVSVTFCFAAVILLKHIGGSNPIFDGITTVLSVVGMYLTVKRCIEQWAVWMIVNGFSAIMWLNLVLQGVKVYATVIMWCVYFILAVYFYFEWKKEIRERKNSDL